MPKALRILALILGVTAGSWGSLHFLRPELRNTHANRDANLYSPTLVTWNAEAEFESESNSGDARSDAAARKADLRILYVGNSHTVMHQLPKMIQYMLESSRPNYHVHWEVITAATLEDAGRNPRTNARFRALPWDAIVLQGQKISSSGRFHYPLEPGIAIAVNASRHAERVLYFSEWGLQGVAGDGDRVEGIYQSMAGEVRKQVQAQPRKPAKTNTKTNTNTKPPADASPLSESVDITVVPLGKAWDQALREHPDWPLHEADGNHQNALGAFLSASVFYGVISGKSPERFADDPRFGFTPEQRKFLTRCAASALEKISPKPSPKPDPAVGKPS